MNDHCIEAELYALGLLDRAHSDWIDEHARRCDPCARHVGRAEAAVDALVVRSRLERSQRSRPSPARWFPIAIAAAFVLTTGVQLDQYIAMRGVVAGDARAYQELVESHFAHAQFVSPVGTPIDAKAIFERHGRWFQIVAERPPDWRVTLVGTDGKRRLVGERPVSRGSASLLLTSPVEPVAAIEIDDADGHTVARVVPMLSRDEKNTGRSNPTRSSGA